MKQIFQTYTGNAMLNASLMTIEAMAQLSAVTDITPELLLQLCQEKKLWQVNSRLKNYSMLFTINGPLYYEDGGVVYNALFREIINTIELEGDKVCELSGLRFNRSFETVYRDALLRIGLSGREIEKRDLSINRVWVPLIGSIGSDAQALPQAKFMPAIHPVCIVLLQFLPLSSLLYRGGIFLVDSSDFYFARTYVQENYNILLRSIESTSVASQITNQSFSKGHYLLIALKILSEKEDVSDVYADLNLWSFTNSGTGAACDIDRIPCSLLRKLYWLNDTDIRKELENILRTEAISHKFLDALEGNQEWNLLYPNKFKKVVHKGVSVRFFETYMRITGNDALLPYARYIATLIREYKSISFDSYLRSTAAWQEKDYRADLQAVLVKAARDGRWSLAHHLHILDSQHLPVRSGSYQLYRCIHFYYQRNVSETVMPSATATTSPVKQVCEWMIALIQQDELSWKITADLTDPQRYLQVVYTEMLCRAYDRPGVELETIFHALMDPKKYAFRRAGLNELLRVFFSQPEQQQYTVRAPEQPAEWEPATAVQQWFRDIRALAADYQAYYYDAYRHRETGVPPYGKFFRMVNSIPQESGLFLYRFREILDNTNNYLKEKGHSQSWSDSILYNPNGDLALLFTGMALKLSLLKLYKHTLEHQPATPIL
ncbi:hypothetical protein [Chitinophaga flava]|uniref:Uncharacterized protein n=1 Tax=Chitinophaga flava TaxID=2259036 RepID=A0A365XS56_9BACT|nr:hypothetical protein [Chitinophaga flava]RBL88970.1 hypothetical protein DF182_20715 [Chitinophaga flava]